MLSIEPENIALTVGIAVVQKALRAIVDHSEIHQGETSRALQKAKTKKGGASQLQETHTVDPRTCHFDPSQHISSDVAPLDRRTFRRHMRLPKKMGAKHGGKNALSAGFASSSGGLV